MFFFYIDFVLFKFILFNIKKHKNENTKEISHCND